MGPPDLEVLIDTGRNQSPPIGIILDDLLYAIFLICHEDQYFPHFPTVASHVCQKWRRIALGGAILWNTIVLVRPNPQMEKYEAWIRRSGDTPLNIGLLATAFQTASIKNMSRILRILLPEAHRWRSLIISWLDADCPVSFPDKVVRLLFDRLRDIAVPELQKLTICLRQSSKIEFWSFQAFKKGTPSLHHVDLEFSSVVWSSPLLHNLRTLRLGAPSFLECIEQVPYIINILLYSPELQSLTVYQTEDETVPSVWWMSTAPSLDSQPSSHPHLTHLDVSAELYYAMVAFIDQLPSLETLRLACSKDVPRPAGSQPLHQVTPALKRLIIDGHSHGRAWPFNPQSYLVKFYTMTSITSVEFTNCNFFHHGWMVHEGFCPPCLETITFINCVYFKPLQLKTLVKARSDWLRKLVLQHYDPDWAPDAQFIGFLDAHGVEYVASKPYMIDRYEYIAD